MTPEQSVAQHVDALMQLRAEALEIFDGPETSQDVRDVIEWYHGSLSVIKSELRTALAADAVPVAWRPIETAPKNGPEILLSNGSSVSQGYWLHREGGITECRDEQGRYQGQIDDDGFIGWFDYDGGMDPGPSHWMPLPPPPSAAPQPATVAADHFVDANKMMQPAPTAQAGVSPEKINSAARVLAECMGYPWEYMNHEGHENLRKNARKIIDSALARSSGEGGAE